MKNLLKLAVIMGLASASTFSYAAGDPIAERKAMMKSVGAATGAAAGMVKGETEFDARVAMLALRTMNAVALGYGSKFPEGSDTGDTKAAATIWSDPDGFAAAIAKFETDTAAAIAAPAADLDAFKAQFGMVTANCGACHKTYQIPK